MSTSAEPQQQHPFKYNMHDYLDPNSFPLLKESLDPENKINKFQVVFQDPKIRQFYWRHITKELQNPENMEDLFYQLFATYKKLRRSTVFKSLSVTFQPEKEEGTLKVLISPVYDKIWGYQFFSQYESGFFGSDSFSNHATFKLRNLAGMMDSLTLGGFHSHSGQPKKGFYLKYFLPSIYKNFNLQFSAEQGNIGLNNYLSGKQQGQTVFLSNDSWTFKLQNVLRTNQIDPIYHSKELLEQEICPTKKISFAVNRNWRLAKSDSLNILALGGEVASVEKAGGFGRVTLKNVHTSSPSFFHQKGRLSLLTIENISSFGLVFPFARAKVLANDKFHWNRMRGFADITSPEFFYDKNLHPNAGNSGFEYLGDYKGDDLVFRNNFKLKFNESPIFRHGGIVPFLYCSYGYFSGDVMTKWIHERATRTAAGTPTEGKKGGFWVDEIKKKSRLSLGVGLERSIGKLRIEGSINLFNFGTSADKTQTFQLRCALYD